MVTKSIQKANVRVKKRFVETATVALGLFLALTYSNLFQDIAKTYLPLNGGNLGVRVFIALVLTYLVVITSIALEKWRK